MKLPQTARRVVITGMSAISPLGSSWADVRSAAHCFTTEAVFSI